MQAADELHSRITPEALKRDAANYMRQTSRNILDTVEQKAMGNPLATVTIGAVM